MTSFKQSLRDMLPPELYQSLQNGRDAIVRLADIPGVYLHPWKLDSNRRIIKYQNRYSGQRCFVIGNGPSLNKMDLSYLKNEITFGMNRVYLAFNEWKFQTSFLVSINDLVIEQSREELRESDHAQILFMAVTRAAVPGTANRMSILIFCIHILYRTKIF